MEIERKYPFENVVFEGGGVLGTAYQAPGKFWKITRLLIRSKGSAEPPQVLFPPP